MLRHAIRLGKLATAGGTAAAMRDRVVAAGRWSAGALVFLVASCTGLPPMPDPLPVHPASPHAEEAPPPAPSDVLETRPAAAKEPGPAQPRHAHPTHGGR